MPISWGGCPPKASPTQLVAGVALSFVHEGITGGYLNHSGPSARPDHAVSFAASVCAVLARLAGSWLVKWRSAPKMMSVIGEWDRQALDTRIHHTSKNGISFFVQAIY